MRQTFFTRIRGILPRIVIGLVVAAAGASHGFASSDNSGATPAQRKACTPDVYRLCAGEIPNVARITACLRRKKSSLSDACRAVFEQ